MRHLPRLTAAVQLYLQVMEDHFKPAAKKATYNRTHRAYQTVPSHLIFNVRSRLGRLSPPPSDVA